MDMIGTCVAAIVLGPWWGALTGVLANVGGAAIYGPSNIPFALANVAGALVWGYGVRTFGMGRNPATYFALNVLVGLVVAVTAAPIVLFVYGGATGHPSDVITAAFLGAGEAMVDAVFASNILVSIADKVIAGFVGLAIIRALPPRYTDGAAAAGRGRDADAAGGDAGHGGRRRDPAGLPAGRSPRRPPPDRAVVSLTGPAGVSVRDLAFTHAGAPGARAARRLVRDRGRASWSGSSGANGAGKTTLCLSLNGVVPHLLPGERTGEVRVGGVDPAVDDGPRDGPLDRDGVRRPGGPAEPADGGRRGGAGPREPRACRARRCRHGSARRWRPWASPAWRHGTR